MSGEISDTIRQQALVMQRNQERLLSLVNQILDLASSRGGHAAAGLAHAGHESLVEERVDQFRPTAEGRGLELRVSLAPQVVGADLLIDREKFDKVLFNLLSNACKFTNGTGASCCARPEPSESL